jgi:hypothetical protein
MGKYIDHSKEEIAEALGIDFNEEMPWVENYFMKYVNREMKFTGIIEAIINDLRKNELDDTTGVYSKYELKLVIAGFLFGAYHTSYLMMSSGMVNIPGYAEIVESIKKSKEKNDGTDT